MLHAKAIILGWALYPVFHIPPSQAAVPDEGLGAHLMKEKTEIPRGPIASQGTGQSPSPEMEARSTCVPSPIV